MWCIRVLASFPFRKMHSGELLLLQVTVDDFKVYEEHFSPSAGTSNSALPALAPSTVDPFQPSFHDRMLDTLHPSVREWPGVAACSSKAEEEEAGVAFKRIGVEAKRPRQITMGGTTFAVERRAGEGAYAKVFRAAALEECGADALQEFDLALKLETPPCPWEW
jgi:hypothetical protein